MEREVGLAVTNSMQLIWVQTDVGSERYHVLFKFTIKQKKKRVADYSTDADMAGHTTRGR
jgi:hypothetical protein